MSRLQPLVLSALLLVSCATASSESNTSTTAAGVQPGAPQVDTAGSDVPNAPTGDPDLDEARALFNAYETRSAAFDPALIELFDPDVVITSTRTGPDGVVREKTMPPGYFHESFEANLRLAELRQDRDAYENVTVTKEDGAVVVRAKRTSLLKCYVDNGFAMRLERQGQDAPLRIQALHTDTQSLSSCPDGDVRALAAKAAQPLEGKLPANVDEETRLDAVDYDDSGLVYQFTFARMTATDIDGDVLHSHLEKIVVAQSCLSPDLRPILDSGGVVSFRYSWADGASFTEFRIRETDCP